MLLTSPKAASRACEEKALLTLPERQNRDAWRDVVAGHLSLSARRFFLRGGARRLRLARLATTSRRVSAFSAAASSRVSTVSSQTKGI